MAQVIKFVKSMGRNKGELAAQVIAARKIEYDCAIPQQWVDTVRERFTAEQLEEIGNIASHFVYVYDNSSKDREEYIMPLTRIGCKILGKLALYI